MKYQRALFLSVAFPLLALAAPETAPTPPATAPATSPATAPGTSTIILGKGKYTGYYLTGQAWDNGKSFYAQPLPTLYRSQIHMRGHNATGTEENTQFIRFDLPPIPDGMEIKDAKLIFPFSANGKADKTKPNKLVIFQALVHWTDKIDWKTYDGEHEWQTPGGRGEKDRKEITTIEVPEHPYDLKTPYETSADITDLVKDWTSAKEPNNGIKLEQIGGYTEYRPEKFRLEITLQPKK